MTGACLEHSAALGIQNASVELALGHDCGADKPKRRHHETEKAIQT